MVENVEPALLFDPLADDDHNIFATIGYDQIGIDDDYLKANEFIYLYYRQKMDVWHAILTILYLHNETLNIWSHLLSCLFYGWLEWKALTGDDESAASTRIELHVFRITAAINFLCSTLFHTLRIVSRPWKTFLNKIDYIGIIVFLSTSGYASIAALFGDVSEYWYAVYNTIGAALCITMVAIACDERFQRREFLIRCFRGLAFLLFECSLIVPYMRAYFGGYHLSPFLNLGWFLILIPLGLGFFSLAFPESLFPGQFDLVPSHALFHICVSVASYLYYKKLCELFL